jgi:hypothetical protein
MILNEIVRKVERFQAKARTTQVGEEEGWNKAKVGA